MSLGDNHLVHSTDNGALFYHRQDTNQPFDLLQYFNSSDCGEGSGSTLATNKGNLGWDVTIIPICFYSEVRKYGKRC